MGVYRYVKVKTGAVAARAGDEAAVLPLGVLRFISRIALLPSCLGLLILLEGLKIF